MNGTKTDTSSASVAWAAHRRRGTRTTAPTDTERPTEETSSTVLRSSHSTSPANAFQLIGFVRGERSDEMFLEPCVVTERKKRRRAVLLLGWREEEQGVGRMMYVLHRRNRILLIGRGTFRDVRFGFSRVRTTGRSFATFGEGNQHREHSKIFIVSTT